MCPGGKEFAYTARFTLEYVNMLVSMCVFTCILLLTTAARHGLCTGLRRKCVRLCVYIGACMWASIHLPVYHRLMPVQINSRFAKAISWWLEMCNRFKRWSKTSASRHSCKCKDAHNFLTCPMLWLRAFEKSLLGSWLVWKFLASFADVDLFSTCLYPWQKLQGTWLMIWCSKSMRCRQTSMRAWLMMSLLVRVINRMHTQNLVQPCNVAY